MGGLISIFRVSHYSYYNIYFMEYYKIFIKYTKKDSVNQNSSIKHNVHTQTNTQICSLLYWMRFNQVHVAFFHLHCINVPIRLKVKPNMNTELVCKPKNFVEVSTNCVLLVLHFHILLSYIPYLQSV